MPSFQALLPCALRSEVESCLWLGYPRRSKFLYLLLHDLEFWDSHDHPSFPPLTPKFLQFVVPSAKYSHCINLGRVLESTVQSKKSLLHKIPWLVSGRLFPANPLFSICFTIKEISKSEAAIIFNFFYHFIHYITKNLAFFCPYYKLFTLYNCWRNVGMLTIIQTSTVAPNSVQFSLIPKNLFCVFVLFWRKEWVALQFFTIKISNFLTYVYNCQLNV